MADPTHDTIVVVSDTIPINIGFIASYSKKLYGDDIQVSLFKYPQTVIDAIKADPPDVLALSNYSWNSHLSERLAQFAKQVNPNIVTLQGGTNFPHRTAQCRDFLLRRPGTDIHVALEGEVAFSNVIARVLDARDGGNGLFDGPIDGCMFIQPSTRLSGDPELVEGATLPRIRDLDVIPSPYLNGMLDHFFDGKLTPFLETNRGCPFKCSFCHTGNDYFQKTNTFSIDRIREEIMYIAPRVAARGIVNLHLADTNFGMYPRDREVCLALQDAREKYGWPQHIMATTGKNNKERVIDITALMGDVLQVTMSVQSMDQKTLANINRENIKLDHYTKINQHLREQGRSTTGELILGMPGETKESFLRGVEQVIDAGVDRINIYTLMLLNGTEFKDPDYRREFGITGKFRIVPLDFGEYEGVRVLDYEEVGIATNDMSFDDYLYLRRFALLVEALHNGHPYEEFFRYAIALGVRRSDFLRRVHDRIDRLPQRLREVINGFVKETRNELWDSEEALIAHYQKDENYQRLVRGEVGGNLIYKYKSLSLLWAAESWVSFLAEICKEIATERFDTTAAIDGAGVQIDVMAEFCRKKLSGLLDADADVAPIHMTSPYDIVGWLHSNEGTPLDGFSSEPPIHYEFYFTDEHLRTRSDLFNRYGADINGLSKVVTRVRSLESLMRKVRTPDGEQVIFAESERDQFTRYTLAG